MATSKVHNDELDIFELGIIFWRHKIILLLTTSLFFGIGLFLSYSVKATYISTFETYTTFNTSLLLENPTQEFEYLFSNIDHFNVWKEKSRESSLSYEDISDVELVDGLMFAKPPSKKIFSIVNEGDDKLSISVFTNEISVIKDFYSYLNFTADKVSTNKRSSLQEILDYHSRTTLSSKSTNLEKIDDGLDLTSELFSIKKVLDQRTSLLQVSRPSLPTKTSMGTAQMTILTSLIGLISSAIFVLGKNAFINKQRARKINSK